MHYCKIIVIEKKKKAEQKVPNVFHSTVFHVPNTYHRNERSHYAIIAMPRNGITCSCRPVHARTSEDDPGLPAHGKEDHNGTSLFLREELAHIGEYNRQGTSYPANVTYGTTM